MNLSRVLISLILFSVSLSVSGCLRWAARAESKLPNETALDKSYDYKGKVIIIGAGASGLAAAKVLEKNQIDYLILEATDRYGGRLKKDTTLADFPIDIGAEWLHSAPSTLNVLKGKKGKVVDEELIAYHLEQTASWDGEKYKVSSAFRNDFMYNFMPESKFKKTTWYDFVDEHLAQSVKHKIQFNSPVEMVDYSGEKVLVRTLDGKQFEADRVLLTVSVGVLRSNKIRFVPEISADRKEALESISFHKGFKVLMKFDEQFYPDAINWIVEDGEKVFYDISFKKEARDNILGFLCKGSSTDFYYNMESEEAIIASLISELDIIFDGQASASYTGEYRLEDWGRYEYTRGTWTQALQEKKKNLTILNKPLSNKVYFAGEINDPYQQMGVPGAILSAYYSIDQLLMRP